jgi:hypothetical protein
MCGWQRIRIREKGYFAKRNRNCHSLIFYHGKDDPDVNKPRYPWCSVQGDTNEVMLPLVYQKSWKYVEVI